jgi:hypothetical protein
MIKMIFRRKIFKREPQVGSVHYLKWNSFGYYLLKNKSTIVTRLDDFLTSFNTVPFYNSGKGVLSEYTPLVNYTLSPVKELRDYLVIRNINDHIDCKLQDKPGDVSRSQTVQVLNFLPFEEDCFDKLIKKRIKENEKARIKHQELLIKH